MTTAKFTKGQPSPVHPKPTTAPPATVVNIMTSPPGIRWRYIGRAMPSKGLTASRWANTFKIQHDTPEARHAALSAYLFRLQATGLFYHVAELRGEALGCFCHPKPCHGDILAKLANVLRFHGSPCPQCSHPVKSSPMQRKEPGRLAEYWRCPSCMLFGFDERGTVALLPDLAPTLPLT